MKIIEGVVFEDDRGTLKFHNDFNMSSVVRMYTIVPKLGNIRAWQGHKLEKKWFYPAKGSFLVKTLNMETLEINQCLITSTEPKVIEIAGGYYNGVEALEEGSILIVYSDFDLQQSKKDDYRIGIDQKPW